MSWGKKSKDTDHQVAMPRECKHRTVDTWEPVEEDGEVVYYNGLCECGIYVRTRKA